MARSSSNDPIEKFRFQVLVFDNVSGTITSGTSSLGTKKDNTILKRAGFSEVITPRGKVKEIEYRENTFGSTLTKQPGLTRYEPVVLKRGMTNDNGLYAWWEMVNNEVSTLNKFQESLSFLSAIPFQEPNFRREVLISSVDRNGQYVKHWLLYNAWPSEYKGVNDFNASSSEIAIEEMSLTFENSIETEGKTVQEALHNITIAAEQAASRAGIVGAAASTLGFLKGLF